MRIVLHVEAVVPLLEFQQDRMVFRLEDISLIIRECLIREVVSSPPIIILFTHPPPPQPALESPEQFTILMVAWQNTWLLQILEV